ncbi:SDR family oxidoreductase [Aliikangiella sp. IMCC44359]|uniref:SDR family oxidoreductase n=1 Tax=Aliikangiella sp. IMCC44359 TaxID=3459125 RepID=UPI00403ADCD3
MKRTTVLITGSAKRLGRATAHAFVQRGCHVMLHYNHSTQAAKSLQQELLSISPRACQLIQSDLNQPDALTKLIDATLNAFGQLDHLINNASIFYPTPLFKNHTEENIETKETELELSQFLLTNYFVPKKLSLLAAPYLTKTNGSITNLIDIYADTGLKDHTAYVAAKSALKAMTVELAQIFAPQIRVNGVSPGAILWPDSEGSLNEEKEALSKSLQPSPTSIAGPNEKQKVDILNNTSLKRLGKPENIAATITYLALDANYTTGSIINVDGGRRDYI